MQAIEAALQGQVNPHRPHQPPTSWIRILATVDRSLSTVHERSSPHALSAPEIDVGSGSGSSLTLGRPLRPGIRGSPGTGGPLKKRWERRLREILEPGPEPRLQLDRLYVPPGKRFRLRSSDAANTGGFKDKDAARDLLEKSRKFLDQHQDRLYAEGTYGLLVILQGMDAAGKDSLIRHVMSGVNPQGCSVTSFKTPSATELNHDYLWRCVQHLPGRGQIGIFNRSYYEETLVIRVHPELLEMQRLPPEEKKDKVWKHRFEDINAFEKHLEANGFVVLKFFLHHSKEEQKKRFLERVENPDKYWKFSSADVRERAYWDDYQKAYEEMIENTSTPWAPWFVLPANHKWYTQLAASALIVRTLSSLNLRYPKIVGERLKELKKARKLLEHE
jgi:PPK2 family polyphosphate:nucleotide phosphotransferase